MLRRFLEAATRSWTFKRSLRVGDRTVRMVVSPCGGLRFLFWPLARVDPLLVRLAEQYVPRSGVVWDVGANLGLFAFSAAAVAGPLGQVFAFEPDPWLIQAMRKSARIQAGEAAPVTVVPVAVAATTAPRRFLIAKRSRAASHLAGYGSTQTGGTAEEHVVVAVSLDWALDFFPPPRLLKIDVEAAELEVLQGAERLIRQHRPIILCEVSEQAADQVTAILKANGYALIDGETGNTTDRAAWSTIAIPSS